MHVQEMLLEDFVKPHIFGTPEQCAKSIQRYVDVGVTYFMLYFPHIDELRSYNFSPKTSYPFSVEDKVKPDVNNSEPDSIFL